MGNSHIDMYAVPLKSLGYEFQSLSSCLLNSKKILPTDGPNRFPRDWRGLASLINIPNEHVENIYTVADKTAKVIDLWCQKRDGTATLGKLMEYLQLIDRYDVYDDVLDLISTGRITAPQNNQVALSSNQLAEVDERDKVITYDDRREGAVQQYHAYVLYAEEDWDFVNELLIRMRAQGLKMCTKLDLAPGHESEYAPVAQLISERCHRIVLVYSPDFLRTPGNAFFTNYAQAIGIESRQQNLLPIIYRKCQLPYNLTPYYKLVYNARSSSFFWMRLSELLTPVQMSRSNGMRPATSSLSITELSTTSASSLTLSSSQLCSSTLSDTETTNIVISHPDDSCSVSNYSIGKNTKKNGVFRKVKKFFKSKEQ